MRTKGIKDREGLDYFKQVSVGASMSKQLQALDASSQQVTYEDDMKILADRAYTLFQNCLDNPNGSQPRQPTQQDWDVQDFPNLDSVMRAIEELLAD